jgi:hypothetical protein
MDAWSAASIKDLKCLGGIPIYNWDESVKAYGCEIYLVSTVAIAAETVLCPLGYSGKGGVSINGLNFGSFIL